MTTTRQDNENYKTWQLRDHDKDNEDDEHHDDVEEEEDDDENGVKGDDEQWDENDKEVLRHKTYSNILLKNKDEND